MASLPLCKRYEKLISSFNLEDDPLFEKGTNWGVVIVAKTLV